MQHNSIEMITQKQWEDDWLESESNEYRVLWLITVAGLFLLQDQFFLLSPQVI